MKQPRIEALHLVALAIDEKAARGTPRHAKALKLSEQAKRLWKEQLSDPKCPHCGKSIR